MCLECIPPGRMFVRDFEVALDEHGNIQDWVASRIPLPPEPGVIDLAGDHGDEIVPPGVEYFVPAYWVYPSLR